MQANPSGLPDVFPDAFWQGYLLSLGKYAPENNVRLPSPKKYHHHSTAVSQVRHYFHGALAQPLFAQIATALKLPFAQGDPIRAFYFLRFFQVLRHGLFITNGGEERSGRAIRFAGAENWENVMCYMDALLFLMFANLESFEPILFVSNRENSIDRLAALLRVYVNLMRLGNVVTTDVTMQICECLCELGFEEALSHAQQDPAPLFEFLSETLRMPLLTFKVEIQHSGKHDDDDFKYSEERILFVSVPEDAEDDVLLEECLELYFNNSISVHRELKRRATMELVHLLRHTRTLSTLLMWSNDERKEVVLPAWMLLRLLPFYADSNGQKGVAKTSREFANHRPVVPVCLKRYSYTEHAQRLQQRIVIPPFIDLPPFVADDVDGDGEHGFRLVLESALCHRGTSINLGHFVAAVRKGHENSLDAEWYLYDDMSKDRVKVTTFREIFDTEWPYMLFFRLVQMESLSAETTRVCPPKGLKPEYWGDLSPVASKAEHDVSVLSSSVGSLSVSGTEPSTAPSSVPSASPTSVPIPPTPPSDPAFVDIRSRYFWYVTDAEMNYYKEHAGPSDSGIGVSRTPQFRRNSQWSDAGELEQKPRAWRKSHEPEREGFKEGLKEHLPPSLSTLKHRKRRHDYHREKCVIT